MKCVLHIGTEKTGTTLLQKWLYENQAELGSQKVYLSNILDKPNNRLFSVYFYRRIDDWARANKINTLDEKAKYFDGFLDKLSAEIKASSYNHDLFLISSEHLHSRVTRQEDLEKIRSFLSEHFDSIDIICYFRPQADMAVSLYSTGLKIAASISLEEFLKKRKVNKENYYFNFKAAADNWSEVFGKKNCVFKIYDRSRFVNGDLRMDFLESLPISLSLNKLKFDIESSNESLGSLMGTVFNKINKYVPYWKANNDGINNLNTLLKQVIKKNTLLEYGKISSPSKAKIMQDFEDSNRSFLLDYFDESTSLMTKDKESENDRQFSFDEVEEIVEALCEDLLPYVDSEASPRLFDKDAEYLRDIALKIDRAEELSINESFKLMQLAHRARPDGPLIQKKVDEYANRLKVDGKAE